jgi:NAD(P)-dependent dehydrogenase (short-subunit alcohol dehydrogenase family)
MTETNAKALALLSFPPGGLAAVFGDTGGIGAALASELRLCGSFSKVLGFSRTGETPINLLDESSLQRAAVAAGRAGDLRLIIDATGFLHDGLQQPEKSLGDITAEKLMRAFALNATGPALIMKHVLPLLPREGKSVFATLSARVGSIGDNALGGWYGYRASKAALNQLVRTAAIELRRRRPEAVCVALHPGTVETRLSSSFSRSGLEVQKPEIAARRLLTVIDHLGVDRSGGFVDHLGKPVPW